MADSKAKPKFKNIVLHWTCGGHYPNEIDLSSYHFLIDVDGKVHPSKYHPEHNLDCTDGYYAPHCGGGNTGRIGVAFCGMMGYTNSSKWSKYPITDKQFEEGCKFVASLCKKYKLSVNQVITHSEFGKKFPETTSNGKIDIDYLPHVSLYGTEAVGNYIRNIVKLYLDQGKN